MACPMSCYCGMVVKCGCNCTTRKENQTPKNKRLVYVLLLGAAETGKSTMMRQMKIIHDGGMSANSLRSYKNHVIRNVHNCLKMLLKAVRDSGMPWASDDACRAAATMTGLNAIAWGLDEDETVASMALVPADHSKLASIIWNDETAQACWNRANEFNLPDSTAYYLNEIERITEEPYIPTQEDVLRLRLPTKAVAMYDFTDDDNGWTFQITDVGGQRGERRRWIRLFDGIHAIIFLAALSEYDQYWSEEEEDGGINRLELSLKLFRETVEYDGFTKATFILFLNKVDILQQKINSSHLDRYFPDYYGPKGDSQKAIKYIRDLFLDTAGACKKSVYPHETCATDTNRTRFIFTAVRDHILWTNMARFFDHIP
ncbi:hypothetical protein HAZT_HAZT006032 [Hyalella azteca]|uniref:Guanine nucleotide-binding protein subunit alpha-14-like n=1 Tax=Hyalella azteca TaxID=294128 RepID=A0A6A0GVP9_HYAAZ|nr:guanine nucleotide-binding protein subunit alpha-14-like [Hyalella azteca]KAA0189850.1 hypothetical protein HAZT_HAZT006032 [Hyalella azteca]